MTLEQKIGQMTQPDIRSITPDEVRQYYIGSILNGGGAWPAMNMHSSVGDWLKLSDEFYKASMSTDMAVKIPVIWGTDAVHGHNNVYGATLFPHNIGLGAAHDPATDGAHRPRDRRSRFARPGSPGLSRRRWRWSRIRAGAGRTKAISSDPALVRSYGEAMVRGLQGQLGQPDFRARHRQALAGRRRHLPRRGPG